MPKIRIVGNSENNQKLSTTKIFKEHLGIGLKEAKDIVDRICGYNIKTCQNFGNVVEYLDDSKRVDVKKFQKDLDDAGLNISINMDKQMERQNKLMVLTGDASVEKYVEHIKELFKITTPYDISHILSDLGKSDLAKIHEKLWNLYSDSYKKD